VSRIYPLIPQHFGGGKPIKVHILAREKDSFIQKVKGDFYLMDRSSTFLYAVLINGKSRKNYEIPVSEVSTIEYR
jgi:hypothetical protein